MAASDKPVMEFPFMLVGSRDQADAKRRTNLAASMVNHSATRRIDKRNLNMIAREAEHNAGLPRGSVHSRQSARGNVYVEASHPLDESGKIAITHFSAHPIVDAHRNTPIGSHHVRTTFRRSSHVIAQARAVGRLHDGKPVFDNLRTVKPQSRKVSYPPGYLKGSSGARMAKILADAYSRLAQRYIKHKYLKTKPMIYTKKKGGNIHKKRHQTRKLRL